MSRQSLQLYLGAVNQLGDIIGSIRQQQKQDKLNQMAATLATGTSTLDTGNGKSVTALRAQAATPADDPSLNAGSQAAVQAQANRAWADTLGEGTGTDGLKLYNQWQNTQASPSLGASNPRLPTPGSTAYTSRWINPASRPPTATALAAAAAAQGIAQGRGGAIDPETVRPGMTIPTRDTNPLPDVNLQGLSSDDISALDWAGSNTNDPRADAIIQLNQSRGTFSF